MRSLLLLPLLFLFQISLAQEEVVQSVYFESGKATLDGKQADAVIDFIKKTDSTRIESIQIFGYTDDVGKAAYNTKLSTQRATAIKDKLLASGVKSKIIVSIEGKGKIMIEDDIEPEKIPEKRSKNRRVDVVLNLLPLPEIVIPGFYTGIQKSHKVGDHIYLEGLLFERGSSKLAFQAKTQLDKLSKLLLKYKNLEFEIQGHVCCTPPYQNEAIDLATKKRKLSTNRAESVYKYLIFKKIPKERMTFKGYGNTKPLGKEPEYDRRVELVITKV
ncbi:OmpA family protein [Flavobacterium silvaticum]|uniref:OmpA family protein n=1 Tax=Flavobacterium silvaticum TaxID=1852020 RepID=A0A972FND6_9FLAO|nr:OmpA family protein [Flavobacterium silvaticum]NMH28435.1 OmpA family protein [Flavobacterium silvaticum]